MLAQLRTYTINKGMMDKWLELFYDELVPRVIEAGMGIPTVAVNHENTKFIWIRTFENEADIEVKEAAFYGSEWWKDNVMTSTKISVYMGLIGVQIVLDQKPS